MDKHLIASAQDPNIILTTKSPLPDDWHSHSHLLKVTIDATNTLAYSGQLKIMLQAQTGKMNISSLSQDLTSYSTVSEQNTNPHKFVRRVAKSTGN